MLNKITRNEILILLITQVLLFPFFFLHFNFQKTDIIYQNSLSSHVKTFDLVPSNEIYSFYCSFQCVKVTESPFRIALKVAVLASQVPYTEAEHTLSMYKLSKIERV